MAQGPDDTAPPSGASNKQKARVITAGGVAVVLGLVLAVPGSFKDGLDLWNGDKPQPNPTHPASPPATPSPSPSAANTMAAAGPKETVRGRETVREVVRVERVEVPSRSLPSDLPPTPAPSPMSTPAYMKYLSDFAAANKAVTKAATPVSFKIPLTDRKYKEAFSFSSRFKHTYRYVARCGAIRFKIENVSSKVRSVRVFYETGSERKEVDTFILPIGDSREVKVPEVSFVFVVDANDETLLQVLQVYDCDNPGKDTDAGGIFDKGRLIYLRPN